MHCEFRNLEYTMHCELLKYSRGNVGLTTSVIFLLVNVNISGTEVKL